MFPARLPADADDYVRLGGQGRRTSDAMYSEDTLRVCVRRQAARAIDGGEDQASSDALRGWTMRLRDCRTRSPTGGSFAGTGVSRDADARILFFPCGDGARWLPLSRAHHRSTVRP
jgi:hypothetical protein